MRNPFKLKFKSQPAVTEVETAFQDQRPVSEDQDLLNKVAKGIQFIKAGVPQSQTSASIYTDMVYYINNNPKTYNVQQAINTLGLAGYKMVVQELL